MAYKLGTVTVPVPYRYSNISNTGTITTFTFSGLGSEFNPLEILNISKFDLLIENYVANAMQNAAQLSLSAGFLQLSPPTPR